VARVHFAFDAVSRLQSWQDPPAENRLSLAKRSRTPDSIGSAVVLDRRRTAPRVCALARDGAAGKSITYMTSMYLAQIWALR
jgi:hypothetical protein